MAEVPRNGYFSGCFSRLSCTKSLCLLNPGNTKISDWWLLLFLAYISSLLVGIIFVVAGFASPDFQMSAVGVVLVIAGASLAVVCDVFRRFGCGWTKIAAGAADPGQINQENSDITLSLPFLPGYPGFCAAGEDVRHDNPPPYVICDSSESPARPCSGCTCGTSSRTENTGRSEVSNASRACSNGRQPAAQHGATFSRSDNRPRQHAASCTAHVRLEHGSHKPAPPPYEFVVINNQGRLSWSSFDSPPPYGDFV